MSNQAKKSEFIYVPLNPTQRAVGQIWRNSRLIFLSGGPGVGKTACGLGLSLIDLISKRIDKIVLCRPAVSIDEDLGHVPGELDEKLKVWMGAFECVLSDMTHEKIENIEGISFLSIGHARGLTIKNGVLLIDESQNLTYRQLSALCTRIGRNGKVVLCGDSKQSDLRANPLPFDEVRKKLVGIEGVSSFTFTPEDQLRDDFITQIDKALSF